MKNTALRDGIIAAIVGALVAGVFTIIQIFVAASERERTITITGDAGYWRESNEAESKKPENKELYDYWKLTNAPHTSGHNRFTHWVPYGVNFEEKPSVSVSIRGFDIGNSGNARLIVFVTEVHTDGFVVAIQTWGNTDLNYADVQWIAYGRKK